MKFQFLNILLLSALTACSGSDANLKLSPVADAELPTEVPQFLIKMAATSPKSAARRLEGAYTRFAKDGVIRFDDLQLAANKKSAERRAQIVARFMGHDADGDGVLTLEEIPKSKHRYEENVLGKLDYWQADVDENDAITVSEVMNYSRLPSQDEHQNIRNSYYWISAFDQDKDGLIPRVEFEAGMQDFLTAHGDKKGAQGGFKSKRRNSMSKSEPVCSPARPTSEQEVVFVSGYEGSGLSSVAVSIPDMESEVARLVIEEGDTPLYIMATGFTPMIWSIEGDVDRVQKFVASPHTYHVRGQAKGQGAGVGVTGLRKDQVEFLPSGCLKYYYNPEDSVEGVVAKAKWSKMIDRKPDHMIGSYKINRMKVPSGENAPKGPRRRLGNSSAEALLYRYAVEGLIVLDPDDIIAPKPMQSYDIMPQQAGLVQLVKSGHLKQLENDTFKIVKQFSRFPAGLNGGHSVTFILAEGVPMPGGSAGHSQVYDAETGECVKGTSRCR